MSRAPNSTGEKRVSVQGAVGQRPAIAVTLAEPAGLDDSGHSLLLVHAYDACGGGGKRQATGQTSAGPAGPRDTGGDRFLVRREAGGVPRGCGFSCSSQELKEPVGAEFPGLAPGQGPNCGRSGAGAWPGRWSAAVYRPRPVCCATAPRYVTSCFDFTL